MSEPPGPSLPGRFSNLPFPVDGGQGCSGGGVVAEPVLRVVQHAGPRRVRMLGVHQAWRRSTPTTKSTSSVARPIHVCTPVPGVIRTTRIRIGEGEDPRRQSVAEDGRQSTARGERGSGRADQQRQTKIRTPMASRSRRSRSGCPCRSTRSPAPPADRVGSFDPVGHIRDAELRATKSSSPLTVIAIPTLRRRHDDRWRRTRRRRTARSRR